MTDTGQAKALATIERLLEANSDKLKRSEEMVIVMADDRAELKAEREQLLRLYRSAGGDPEPYELGTPVISRVRARVG